MSSDKRQFLDPISTVGRIVLLHFSNSKTKIRIVNHAVQLIENPQTLATDPSDDFGSKFTSGFSTMVSSMSRTYYGDSRADISVLYPIFVRYIELYLVEKQQHVDTPVIDKKDNLKKNKSIDEMSDSGLSHNALCYKYLKKIGEYSIIGMKELQKTYGQDNATFALQYYID
jgi:hypothetical protein